jgi:DNA replication protein DnaC
MMHIAEIASEWEKRREIERVQRASSLGITLEEMDNLDAEESKARKDRELIRMEKEFAAAWRSSWFSTGAPSRAIGSMESLLSTPALVSVFENVSADLLVLAGTPGVGKTVAACVWMDLARGKYEISSCKWVQAGELARGYAYEQEAFDSVAKSTALVIDDLGTEFLDQKERYLCTLEEILSKRYAHERPTLLTTNLSPEKFKERYGERLVSRIHEDGAFIVCGGQDMRRASK